MKPRQRLIQLFLLWTTLLWPAGLQAQFTSTINNGAFVITGYTGPGGTVTIPGTTNGLPVIIGAYAFLSQSALTNLTIMNGVVGIGSNSFGNCVNLTAVAIPGSVTNIGNYAFDDCVSLTNVVISNGVANISEGAFGSTSMSSIIIPGSVSNIGPSAFNICYQLKSVTLGNGVESIGPGAFYYCGLSSVFIPSNVVNVGAGAFESCSSLTNLAVDLLNPNYTSAGGVLFNKTLTTLAEYVCEGNGNDGYVIPAGVTCIGDSAFEECPLTSVTIPWGVNQIGDSAFYGCDHLPNLTIPGSVTNIGAAALSYCFKMTNIVVDPAGPNYASAGGVLFDKAFQTLIQYPAGNTGAYVIPDSVVNIGSAAFESSDLTAVTIPNSVTNIGDWAFGYSSLTSATVPGNVGSIGDSVFLNCGYLTNVTLLNGITNIESWAFFACESLTTVTLPASLQTVAVFAFSDCPDLTGVYCYGNAPGVLTTPFNGSNDVFSGDSGTIYYLPDTTGWANTFGGLSTSPVYPIISASGSRLGVNTNPFGFTISWAMNTPVVVEACTNLVRPAWQPVQTNTPASGAACFSDPQWTNYPNRYYRLRSP